jgi:hypothetical protein
VSELDLDEERLAGIEQRMVYPDWLLWIGEEEIRALVAEVRRLRAESFKRLHERAELFKRLHDEKWAEALRVDETMTPAVERDTYDHAAALRDSVVGALNRERDRNRVGRYGPFPETSR